MKCIKSTARLLDIDCVNKRSLDLSKEVLWVSVGQRTAKIQAVKVRDLKMILPLADIEPNAGGPGSSSGRWYGP